MVGVGVGVGVDLWLFRIVPQLISTALLSGKVTAESGQARAKYRIFHRAGFFAPLSVSSLHFTRSFNRRIASSNLQRDKPPAGS